MPLAKIKSNDYGGSPQSAIVTAEDPYDLPAIVTDVDIDKGIDSENETFARNQFRRAYRHKLAQRGIDAVEKIIDTTISAMESASTPAGTPDHRVRISAAQFMAKCIGGEDESEAVTRNNFQNILTVNATGTDAVMAFLRMAESARTGVPVNEIQRPKIPTSLINDTDYTDDDYRGITVQST